MRTATLGELVKWVMDNRKGNAFKDYEERVIASGIKLASDLGTLLYMCRDDGSLCGIIVCREDQKNRLMYVVDLLTTERWVLPMFVKYFVTNYPEYTLTALRDSKPVTYDTKRLCHKLLKGA